MLKWAPADLEKPRHLNVIEKAMLVEKTKGLVEKAEQRDERCWVHKCDRIARVWVREVGFDFKGDKAELGQHIAVSSSDYPGPVPGFCYFHMAGGPEELAEKVYFDRPEMYWGVRPNRWIVIFTDGTKRGGSCIELDPKMQQPKIVQETIKAER